MEKKFPSSQISDLENREKTSKRVIEFLKRIGFFELANDPIKKEKFIQENLTIDKVEPILERLNGIIIGAPTNHREIYKNSGQVSSSEDRKVLYVPPHPGTQKVLLETMVLPAIKKLPLEDAAVLAALEINLLHMFPDGNGRLSRLVYLLMQPSTEVTDTPEGISLIESSLSERKGSLNFNPAFIEEELNEEVFKFSISKHPDVLLVNSALALDQSQRKLATNENSQMAFDILALALRDDGFDVTIGLREFIFKEKSQNADQYLIKRPDGSFTINTLKILNEVHQQSDIQNLINYLNLTKTIRIRIAADIFLRPEKYKSKEENVTLRDHFLMNVLAYKEE